MSLADGPAASCGDHELRDSNWASTFTAMAGVA